ncbi:MAG: hypothetical protein ABH833_03025 [Parcubacteria group bacterium]
MDEMPKANAEQELPQDKRKRQIRDASLWIETNVGKYENQDLTANGIELYSDEPLDASDIEHIIEIKKSLDTSRQAGATARVVILCKENWSRFTSEIGGRSQELNGSSEEYPIVPEDVTPFVVLPSSDVFKENTFYGKLYKLGVEMRELIDSDNATGSVETYRNVYLRNVLSHELAHLYQFSNKEKGAILESDEAGYSEKNNLLSAREFIAVAFGIYQMRKGDLKYRDAFLDASKAVVESAELKNEYVKEQARRTLDAEAFIEAVGAGDIERAFKAMHEILQSDDKEKKGALQENISLARKGEIGYDAILNTAT